MVKFRQYIGRSKYNTEGLYLLLQNEACANGLQFNGGISCDSTSQPAANSILWNYVRVWQAVPFQHFRKRKSSRRGPRYRPNPQAAQAHRTFDHQRLVQLIWSPF